MYRENYVALPMKSSIQSPGSLRFEWRHQGVWGSVSADSTGEAFVPVYDHAGHYVSEHYWGFAAQRDGGTLEYQVEHPPWKIWNCENVKFDCRVKELYGDSFADALMGRPHSAFIADGSDVVVRDGVRIK